jgi:hypothetical protein
LKIVSKRGKPQSDPQPIPGLEVTEISNGSIIIDAGGELTPDELHQIEEVFRQIRRQLEQIYSPLT